MDDKPGDRGEHVYSKWDDEDEHEFQQIVRATCQSSPEKLKKKREAFVKVPVQLAGNVALVTRERKTFIWIWLLYLSWKSGSRTVSLSNNELRKWRISRDTKRRALAALERAGLLKVEWRPGRSVLVTLLQ
jgi:hypothetical protein